LSWSFPVFFPCSLCGSTALVPSSRYISVWLRFGESTCRLGPGVWKVVVASLWSAWTWAPDGVVLLVFWLSCTDESNSEALAPGPASENEETGFREPSEWFELVHRSRDGTQGPLRGLCKQRAMDVLIGDTMKDIPRYRACALQVLAECL
jgi:hypothetical protein